MQRPDDTTATLIGRYSDEVRDAAVAAVDQRRLQNPRDRTIYREIAKKFAVGEQSLRLWVKKSDAERLERSETSDGSGNRETSSEEERLVSQRQLEAELDKMRRQIQKLKAENEVLKRAFVVFSSEWEESK
jgi:transposase